jgi:hypothetical protein
VFATATTRLTLVLMVVGAHDREHASLTAKWHLRFDLLGPSPRRECCRSTWGSPADRHHRVRSRWSLAIFDLSFRPCAGGFTGFDGFVGVRGSVTFDSDRGRVLSWSRPDVEPGRFDAGGLGLEGWEVDAGVNAVLFDGVGEPAVAPVVVVDVAEDVDDLGQPGYIQLVAIGEPPPAVEGVEALLELGDRRGHPPVELGEHVLVAQLLVEMVDVVPGLVVALDVGAGVGSNLFIVLLGPCERVVGGGELSPSVSSATEP